MQTILIAAAVAILFLIITAFAASRLMSFATWEEDERTEEEEDIEAAQHWARFN